MWGAATGDFNVPGNAPAAGFCCSARQPGADGEEFPAACVAQTVAILPNQGAQRLLDRLAERGHRLLWCAVGAAQWLRDDAVDDPEPLEILGGQFQRLGRFGGV